MHATLDSQVTFFYQILPPEGDLATKLYTSDKENVEIEIAYTSGETNVEIEKVYTSAQIHDFRTIKGKQVFAIALASLFGRTRYEVVLCEKLKNLSCESKVACTFLEKMSQKALNRVLTVPQHSTRRELSGTTLKIV